MVTSAVSAALATVVAASALVLVGCTANPPTSSPSGDSAEVGVTALVSRAGLSPDGSTVTAAGYVSGVIESGGTCTFSFTAEGESVSDTTVGSADATTTTCGELALPVSRLTPGTWTVLLSYRSDDVSATSDPLDLEIP